MLKVSLAWIACIAAAYAEDADLQRWQQVTVLGEPVEIAEVEDQSGNRLVLHCNDAGIRLIFKPARKPPFRVKRAEVRYRFDNGEFRRGVWEGLPDGSFATSRRGEIEDFSYAAAAARAISMQVMQIITRFRTDGFRDAALPTLISCGIDLLD
jgi:hypothetical protein